MAMDMLGGWLQNPAHAGMNRDRAFKAQEVSAKPRSRGDEP